MNYVHWDLEFQISFIPKYSRRGEIKMSNDVWIKIAQFLGSLNGENIGRESYVRTPEYEKALKVRNETEEEWEEFLRALSAGQQEKAEKMKGHLEDVASAQEKRAYIQGFAYRYCTTWGY